MAKRPLHLSTPREIRAALAKIANETRSGEMTPQMANALVCVCNAILGCIRTDEQERKIVELEKTLAELEERK